MECEKVKADMPTPLFVDVDGTLTRADISLESFVRIARSNITNFFLVLIWLLRGRAVAKAMAARRDPVEPANLPYRKEILDQIKAAQMSGRPVILASASHWRNIRRIARYLILIDPVIATAGRSNLKGKAKLDAIWQRVGKDGRFDYIGDNKADTVIWREAVQGFSVNYIPARSTVRAIGMRRFWLHSLLKSMRPHQWAKNALVLVPVMTSGQFSQLDILLVAFLAACCMSFIASSIYLLNDVLDIDADRAHHTKRQRPLARGDLSIPVAIIASIILASGGLLGGWLVGGGALVFWLLAYMAITTAYSLRLKAVMVGDAIVLTSLYTIRVWIGGVAIGITLSFWLMLFSVFLFLSLAYLKRYIELRDATEPERLLNGRGYVGGDLDVVMSSGVSAGMVSILVLALFAHDAETATNYASPDLLWLLCLPLLYWLNRIWMMARRGEVEGDPVAFAIKDQRSILVGTASMVILILALVGVPNLG